MDETHRLEGVEPTLQEGDDDAINLVILERIAMRFDEGEFTAVLPEELESQSESFATDVFQWVSKVDAVQLQLF